MTARGGTHLPTKIYEIPSSRGPTYLLGYRNVERRHRNLPTPDRDATPRPDHNLPTPAGSKGITQPWTPERLDILVW
jgi:hypothetical protein